MTYAVDNITVRYGDVVALDRVSAAIEPGRVLAVVGGDGAGKSTLLRALVGEVALAAGSVQAPDPYGIGYLPASTGSWLELSVQENVDFVGGVYGLGRPELARRADHVLASAGLLDARDRLSSQLSGGMRRKLGFCLAIVHEPPLLVLDEPSTGVDPVSRVDLWRLVSRAAAAGAAVVMSTTYLDEAERAEHLLVLDRGQAVVQGAPDDVLAEFPGAVTRVAQPQRADWAWRRGRAFHEYWPDPASAGPGERVQPDLEDVVVASSLLHRSRRGAA